jgi:hypothetical protein
VYLPSILPHTLALPKKPLAGSERQKQKIDFYQAAALLFWYIFTLGIRMVLFFEISVPLLKVKPM